MISYILHKDIQNKNNKDLKYIHFNIFKLIN